MTRGIYPCVIFATRYQGTYEGGVWAAVEAYNIPCGAQADDVTACNWWAEHGPGLGVGASPEDAYAALVALGDRRVDWSGE